MAFPSETAVKVQPKSIEEMRDVLKCWFPASSKGQQSPLKIRLLSGPEGLEVRSTTSESTRIEFRPDAVVWWKGNCKVHMATDYFDVRTSFEGKLFVIHFRPRYSAATRPLSERLSSVEKTKYPNFVSRALGALVELERELPPERIEEAIIAPNDFSVLLSALSAPAVITQLVDKDPLAAAKLRGVKKQQELLRTAGGVLSGEEVAQILRISRQAVDKRRRQQQLIALSQGRRGYAYPAFQFENGKTIPHLERILKTLGSHDPWMKFVFFINPNTRLGNRSALQALRAGDVEDVVNAATAYGEQGAA